VACSVSQWLALWAAFFRRFAAAITFVRGMFLRTILFALLLAGSSVSVASAQEDATAPSPHAKHTDAQQQDMSMSKEQMPGMHMDMPMPSQPPSPHEGSGTAWQPASVTGHAWMWMSGGWMWMAHGAMFIDYNQQGGPRGEGKAESVN
jgi:hypothetical protein